MNKAIPNMKLKSGWLCCDAEGIWIWFYYKPVINGETWETNPAAMRKICMGDLSADRKPYPLNLSQYFDIEPSKDWKHSLIKIS